MPRWATAVYGGQSQQLLPSLTKLMQDHSQKPLGEKKLAEDAGSNGNTGRTMNVQSSLTTIKISNQAFFLMEL